MTDIFWCIEAQGCQLLFLPSYVPIIALSEKSGLYVQDNVVLAVGFEPVVVFHHDVLRIFPPSSVVPIE
ncbi:hypothetical protein KDW_38080 [Dictyobacter vulcani]|uniref:Uncharacterized protein n=1 Tax=Dictyobacter vulcani TaxID=2607529 RepID=A0A5J4KWR2_9CHLR|nr:hypothetical protein KDW_38080 [Dictyobacter vulcani]